MAVTTRTEVPGEGRLGVARFAGRGPTSSRGLPDGSVVSVTREGIFEWEGATGLLRRTVWFLEGLVPERISLAGDVFFLDERTLRVWRRANNEVQRVCEVAGPPPGSAAWVVATAISVSADGSSVAFERDKRIEVLRCADGGQVAAIERPWSDGGFSLGQGGRWVLFARDVAVQSGSGWTEYAVFATAPVARIHDGHLAGDDASVGFSNDGLAVEYSGREEGGFPLDPAARRLQPIDVDRTTGWPEPAVPFAVDSAGGRALTWRGGRVIALDLKSGAMVPIALGELPPQKASAFSADGKCFGFLPREGQGGVVLQLVDPSARRRFEVPAKRYPRALAVLPDGQVLLVSPLPNVEPAELAASRDGRVLAVRTGSWSDPRGPLLVAIDGAVETLAARDTPQTAARCIALCGDGGLLAVSTWDGLEVWETSPAKRVRTIASAPAIALAFAADGRALYALHADCTMGVHEAA